MNWKGCGSTLRSSGMWRCVFPQSYPIKIRVLSSTAVRTWNFASWHGVAVIWSETSHCHTSGLSRVKKLRDTNCPARESNCKPSGYKAGSLLREPSWSVFAILKHVSNRPIRCIEFEWFRPVVFQLIKCPPSFGKASLEEKFIFELLVWGYTEWRTKNWPAVS